MFLFQRSSVTRNVSTYLQRISAVYDVKKFVYQPIHSHDVVDYYVQSHIAYRLLHSVSGSIHMAVSRDERFRFNDYLAQVNFIDEQICAYQPESILELGCGNGFNLIRLAQKHLHRQFIGIDLTPLHISNGLRQVEQKRLNNTLFELGDFHQLDYPTASLDMVFAIESICHAKDIFSVMSEVYRVLKPGGVMVIYDGFRVREHDTLNADEKIARHLIEKTLAVNESAQIDSFVSGCEVVGFRVLENTDLSQTILPNLERFHDLARILFEFRPLGHLTRTILPNHLAKNAIAAYLMPILVGNGTQGYFRLCFQKPIMEAPNTDD